jgi:hypothetical protein
MRAGTFTVHWADDYTIDELGTPTAKDVRQCGAVTVAHSDTTHLSCDNTGTVTRTWTATDQCGNVETTTQTITRASRAGAKAVPNVLASGGQREGGLCEHPGRRDGQLHR